MWWHQQSIGIILCLIKNYLILLCCAVIINTQVLYHFEDIFSFNDIYSYWRSDKSFIYTITSVYIWYSIYFSILEHVQFVIVIPFPNLRLTSFGNFLISFFRIDFGNIMKTSQTTPHSSYHPHCFLEFSQISIATDRSPSLSFNSFDMKRTEGSLFWLLWITCLQKSNFIHVLVKNSLPFKIFSHSFNCASEISFWQLKLHVVRFLGLYLKWA